MMTLKERSKRKKMVRLDVRVPRNLREYAELIAEEAEVTLSDVVRDILTECLPKRMKEEGLA